MRLISYVLFCFQVYLILLYLFYFIFETFWFFLTTILKTINLFIETYNEINIRTRNTFSRNFIDHENQANMNNYWLNMNI